MIVLDADVIIIDLGYASDPKYLVNKQFLVSLALHGIERGITTQGLLEVVGKRSYQTPITLIPNLPAMLLARFGLTLIPDPVSVPEYAGCTFDAIVAQMVEKMALGDAVMAVQIAKFAPNSSALITWNAKHFQGKLAIPTLTPEEWLLQQNSAAAPSPPTGPIP